MTWFAFAIDYAAMKWSDASPNYRRGIAEALTDITEALLPRRHTQDRRKLRAATRWAFSDHLRDRTAPPPVQLASAYRWLQHHTVTMDVFARRATAAQTLLMILSRLDRAFFNLSGGVISSCSTPSTR